MTIKQANKKMQGTGYFIDPLNPTTKRGYVRVMNESLDTICFYAPNIQIAVKRAIGRCLDDWTGFNLYQNAGKKEKTYTKYVRIARYKRLADERKSK